MNDWIKIQGARENNLKNISLSIPRNKLVVLTGLSGSGKSTLAMNTLQQECQRQYMDSLGMISDFIHKPKVDSIEGLSPSICIDQRHTNRNPRSTVGTTTDLYTLLRILFTKSGERACPNCGSQVKGSSSADIWQENYESIETEIQDLPMSYSDEGKAVCPECSHELRALTMSHFSFNKPEGACPVCMGLGVERKPNLQEIFDDSLSLKQCALKGSNPHGAQLMADNLVAAGNYYGFVFDPDKPLRDLGTVERDLLYFGVYSQRFIRHFPGKTPPTYAAEGRFEGILTNLERRYKERGHESDYREKIEKFFHLQECSDCHGTKLNADSRAVTLAGKSITEASAMPLFHLLGWLRKVSAQQLGGSQDPLMNIVSEMEKKLARLIEVGVGYLSLDRSTVSLSLGEMQRLKLVSLIGASLTGVLYILDEPTIGLHPIDTEGLLRVLRQLRDLGNTVLVIEHDPDVMRAADYLIDIGPGAGKQGGEVVAAGSVHQLIQCSRSWTGQYFAGKDTVVLPEQRRRGNGKCIEITNANRHNLKDVSVNIPLGKLVVLTGVSGSGKSTLMFDVLARSAQLHFTQSTETDAYADVKGWENVHKVISFDQSPIGQTARSNAATYTDVYTAIRNIFAALPEAKMRNLQAKHFSCNVPGGRCERCQGAGLVQVNLQFLPSVETPCPVCRTKRFKPEILDVKYKNHSISDVLACSVKEGMELFADEPSVYNKLDVMCRIGLDYLILGQPATTLSGGEAQRVKLARELSKSSRHHTLYLLDEPTTGLHPHDVIKLIDMLGQLVDSGNSVVVIEHNTDVLVMADWIIDMGPEGGLEGGQVLGESTPENIAEIKNSKTGRIVNQLLNQYQQNLEGEYTC
ncbi:excinuclease ABC subunit UvrA [Paenibacillus odorifer]|uniref:excinuclease ABC subunit UvrA n=1 Tax=Paenibacillus odorifer TaxID=189426 RepID=UPI002DB6AD4D|nr:excinuclease ABC subunit UvrA [Paenibacillus odorifer]MEC0220916.1 excinuclease ABC subunit UvrA [Paenibacillus odorifer]